MASYRDILCKNIIPVEKIEGTIEGTIETVFMFLHLDKPINLEESPHVKPLELTASIDWIKKSRQKYNITKKNINHTGPIYTANWLSDKLCVGGYPTNKSDLNKLLGAGIDTFVCLNGTDKSKFYKYEDDLPPNKNYIHESIRDMNITTDEKMRELCEDIYNIIRKKGGTVYVHCAGGHGRTGTVAAIVLHMLYKLPLVQIFDYIQYSHDQRDGNYFGPLYFNKYLDELEPLKYCFDIGQVPTPQASCQRQQVKRIINGK